MNGDSMQVEDLPAGYKFLPNDAELIVSYLRPKIDNGLLPVHFIHDVNVYDHTPQDLAGNYAKYPRGEGWYFFTPREKKYPKGTRPKRSAGAGYWKPTGKDRDVTDESGEVVGRKQSLVYYLGKQPNGTKTTWMMYEYKILPTPDQPAPDPGNMKLDECVLCYIKNNATHGEPAENTEDSDASSVPVEDQQVVLADQNDNREFGEPSDDADDQDGDADFVLVADQQVVLVDQNGNHEPADVAEDSSAGFVAVADQQLVLTDQNDSRDFGEPTDHDVEDSDAGFGPVADLQMAFADKNGSDAFESDDYGFSELASEFEYCVDLDELKSEWFGNEFTDGGFTDSAPYLPRESTVNHSHVDIIPGPSEIQDMETDLPMNHSHADILPGTSDSHVDMMAQSQDMKTRSEVQDQGTSMNHSHSRIKSSNFRLSNCQNKRNFLEDSSS